jgi:hypothetical protein
LEKRSEISVIRISQTIPPELAAHLKRAAATGQSVHIQIDDRPYELTIAPVAGNGREDIWAHYDAERLRRVLRRNAALPERVEPEALDDLLAEIRANRGQDSVGRPAHS